MTSLDDINVHFYFMLLSFNLEVVLLFLNICFDLIETIETPVC